MSDKLILIGGVILTITLGILYGVFTDMGAGYANTAHACDVATIGSGMLTGYVILTNYV